jgi:aminoglycoside phosphotransferase (APT) family kinase protein
MSEIRGLNLPATKAWLANHVDGADAELTFELVAAGGSNLTYIVERGDGQRWALRRPPERARIATAHEMSREWKILAALHAHPESGIPVPEAVAYCDDPEINGAEFYVMGFAEGLILRGPEDAKTLDNAQCRIAAESLIDVQIAMARLDADAVGLGDLGRKEAYVERQLARWLRQFEAAKGRKLPMIYELHEQLLKNVPTQQACGLVHGDYRFDNTVLGPDCRILAVLDWELCTLGDPVADFCWSVLYWTNPDEDTDFGSPSPTRHPAFPRREEAIELYADRSGFDLSGLAYYRAFSWWKMACLLEGVAARLRAGAGGGAGAASGIDNVYSRVDSMLELAVEAAKEV